MTLDASSVMMDGRIRPCTASDLDDLYDIINDGASAYRGIIPADRLHEPYMDMTELLFEISDGVEFSGYEEDSGLLGVMGLQDKGEVCLIRHAYVRSSWKRKGIGARLLGHLEKLISKPVLMGTWKDAHWAIRFYEKHGYRLVGPEEKDQLLRRYWKIPERQIEASVVLANKDWF